MNVRPENVYNGATESERLLQATITSLLRAERTEQLLEHR